MVALFLLVSQFAVSPEPDLQVPRQVFFAEQIGYPPDALALFTGDLQQSRLRAGNFGDRGIAQKTNHLPREVRRTVSLTDEMVHLAENFFALRIGDSLHD